MGIKQDSSPKVAALSARFALKVASQPLVRQDCGCFYHLGCKGYGITRDVIPSECTQLDVARELDPERIDHIPLTSQINPE
jgi:hypothetical protein